MKKSNRTPVGKNTFMFLVLADTKPYSKDRIQALSKVYSKFKGHTYGYFTRLLRKKYIVGTTYFNARLTPAGHRAVKYYMECIKNDN